MKLKDWKFFKLSKESFFRVPRFSLDFIGFWPDKKINFWEILKIALNSIAFLYEDICEMVYVCVEAESVFYVLSALCPLTTQIVTLLKLVLFLWYRNEFTSFIRKLWDLWKDADKSNLEYMKLQEMKATIFAFSVFFCGFSTSFWFILRPITNGLIDIMNGRNFTRELPFAATFPYDTKSSPGYEISYVFFVYTIIVTPFGFAGVDGMYFAACSYISTIFHNIQADIKDLVKSDELMLSSSHNNFVFQQLRFLIQRHQLVMELSDQFIGLYQIIALMHFTSVAIVLCVSLIDFLMSTGISSILYVSYSMAVLTQVFMYCYGGSAIYDSSREVATAIYFSDWYKCDIRNQRILAIMHVRAQKGTKPSVPFFTPSLETFGTILSTTMSYVTLLKTFL